MSAKKRDYTVLVVDPGLANTGLVVARIHYVRGKINIEILHTTTFYTDTSKTMSVRTKMINGKVAELIEEYKPSMVVCEAFEVRGWQQPRKNGGQMSKLVNDISATVFSYRLPFLLSSPDVKKLVAYKEEVSKIRASLGRHSEHVGDALVHLVVNVRNGKV